MSTGANRYWHLKTWDGSIPPNSQGGNIYDYIGGQMSNPYTPGAWYMEIHYLMGNWYCNRIN